MSFAITELVLASAVADEGTVTVAYPTGTAQADYIGSNAASDAVVVLNDNDVILQGDPGIAISYGASNATLTNDTGIAWPAGTRLRVQFASAGNDRPGFSAGPAIASLTDSSGGTAAATLPAIGATYAQAEVRNSVASLNAKLDAILIALRDAGIIAKS